MAENHRVQTVTTDKQLWDLYYDLEQDKYSIRVSENRQLWSWSRPLTIDALDTFDIRNLKRWLQRHNQSLVFTWADILTQLFQNRQEKALIAKLLLELSKEAILSCADGA